MADTFPPEKAPGADETADLVRRAAQGDDGAFAALAAEYAPVIRALIPASRLSQEDRNDLYQEGLIGLYKAALLYDPALSSFSTFARVCIRSAVLDAMRTARKDRLSGAEELCADSFPDLAPSPERILMGKEALSALLARLDLLLSPLERRVLGLHLQGMKQKEIASLLGRDAKSVENTLFRLRRKLSKLS